MAAMQEMYNMEEMMKVAQGIPNPQCQFATKGCMKNQTDGMMKYYKSHDYDGFDFAASYPPFIPAHGSVQFVHPAHGKKGSEEAVIYSGTNKHGVACAWLLAFSAPNHPTSTTPNKVYVECGKLENYNHVDWCDIEKKLDASTNESHYRDMATGCTAIAKIDEGINIASIAACFGSGCN